MASRQKLLDKDFDYGRGGDIYKIPKTKMKGRSEYDEINEEILKITRKKIQTFLSKGKFPLGTRKPLYTYHLNIPDDEIVWFPFPKPTSPLSILILATSGYKKTVIQKRLAYYFYKVGWNVFVLEPKTIEWLIARRKPLPFWLYKYEKPDKLPIIPFIPSFIIDDVPRDVISGYDVITSRLSDFNKRIYFNTLKFAPAGVEWLISNAHKYSTPKEILEELKYLRLGSMKSGLMLRLGALSDDNFFDSRYRVFDKKRIKKHWKKKKIPVVSFFSQDLKYLSLYTGYIMREIFKLSIEDSQFQKKIIFVDDCSLLVGSKMDIDEYLSVRELINSITLWRTLGFMMVFASQSPGLINPAIIDDCKWLMIGRIGNPSALKNYVGNPDIIKVIRKLRYVPSRYLTEYCLIHPDRITFERFFPFNSPVGHFIQEGDVDVE